MATRFFFSLRHKKKENIFLIIKKTKISFDESLTLFFFKIRETPKKIKN